MHAELIAGYISGATGILVGHPLDTVKARLQTSSDYKGIVDCFVKTVRQESLFGLYRGLLIPFLSAGAINSLLFSGYAWTLKLLHPGERGVEERSDLPMHEILLATWVGTLVQLVPVIPIDLVKTRLQVQHDSISVWGHAKGGGHWHCAKDIVARHGLIGLYKGGGVMCVRDLLGFTCYFPVYEVVKHEMQKRKCNETLSQLMAGGCAGSAGWWSICPFEVVKNRIQTWQGPGDAPGMVPLLKQVYAQEGVRGWFRGGLTLILRGFPVNAVVFLSYEQILKKIQ